MTVFSLGLFGFLGFFFYKLHVEKKRRDVIEVDFVGFSKMIVFRTFMPITAPLDLRRVSFWVSRTMSSIDSFYGDELLVLKHTNIYGNYCLKIMKQNWLLSSSTSTWSVLVLTSPRSVVVYVLHPIFYVYRRNMSDYYTSYKRIYMNRILRYTSVINLVRM